MSNKKMHWLDRELMRRIMRQHKSNDWLVLDDAALMAALDGTHPLNRTEWAALIDSPLTLRRMQFLEGRRRVKRVKPDQAANDDRWAASDGLLRAAASGDAAFVLVTDDGFWKLEFPRADEGWWIVLQLDRSAPFADEFLAESNRPEVAVLDGLGATLLIGALDDDGSLLGRWPGIQPPMAAISAAGGGFQVLRV